MIVATRKKKARLVHVLCETPKGFQWLKTNVRGATLTGEGFLVTDEGQWATYLQAAGGKEI